MTKTVQIRPEQAAYILALDAEIASLRTRRQEALSVALLGIDAEGLDGQIAVRSIKPDGAVELQVVGVAEE